MSIPGPASPDVLSVRGVSKAFGAVQALRDVGVDCRAGEIHALVGENGSGKSTLLGIASGSLAPDWGTVEIGGVRLRRHSPAAARRLGLGIAYQDYSHVLGLSVAENVYLAVPAEDDGLAHDGGRSLGEVEVGKFAKHKGRLIKKLAVDEFATKYKEYHDLASHYFESVDRGDTINDVVVKLVRDHAAELVLPSPV